MTTGILNHQDSIYLLQTTTFYSYQHPVVVEHELAYFLGVGGGSLTKK
jgi:hypothetical protein